MIKQRVVYHYNPSCCDGQQIEAMNEMSNRVFHELVFLPGGTKNLLKINLSNDFY